ncbi:MAG: hypothetical protein ACJ72E_08580 [Marmoricola sp.]
MRSLGLVTRINVLTAIRDHDLQGATDFREALGFSEPSGEVLVERGKRYDARALLAYAHGKATGDYLDPDRVSFGALDTLTTLGFRVATIEELDRPKAAPARTRAASTPRASRAAAPKKAEPVLRLCPTCFTQLSVTGACDYCD